MFTPARQAARKFISDEEVKDGQVPEILRGALPQSYSLSDILNNLTKDSTSKKADVLENLLILHLCLEDASKLRREPRDEEHVQKLLKWISQSILPDESIIPQSDIPSDNESTTIAQAILTTKRAASQGFECLSLLDSLLPSPPPKADPETLLPAIAFVSSRDSWVTSAIIRTAQKHLSHYNSQVTSREFIVNFLLQNFIRPLFSKSRPSTITSTGRKAIPSSEPPKRFDAAAETRDKPWKYRKPYAVTVLEWTVQNASEGIISQNWNLFIPPLLTLIDDPSTSVRLRGLNILSTFLPKFPSPILAQTGLAPVFEDAIHPTLLFLPSLTPVEESVQLLPAAYVALNALCDARFAEKNDKERIKFLDQVIRRGVLPGYQYASEHPAIVHILVKELASTTGKLGIHSVKHLKDILPILSAILEDPFTAAALLRTSIKTLEATILNAWPRISEPVHRMTILKSLVLCWNNVTKSEVSEDVTAALTKVANLFVKVVEKNDEAGIKGDMAKLVQADPRLEKLFGL
ncbi:hypothetical protein B0O99DRAFT_625064 [Bisporella sp. PMI_857]|nr:hypothetical protein B0O99DRAFT_625064 [Bisporella sp. PMI_857]